MISTLFQRMTHARSKRRRRPKLPNRAERLYLGALRRYAETFRGAVLALVEPELRVAVRQDALTGGPFKGLQNVRLTMAKAREQLPLDLVGAEVASHAQGEAERVIGLKNSDLFLRGQVAGWRRANVDLVTAMTDEMLDRVQTILDGYDGSRVEVIATQLEGAFGMTRARAELIARDQVLKLNSNMAEQSQRAAGVTHYTWSTSQDSSVREDTKGRGDPDHAKLNGLVFSWDDPPVTCERTGDRNHPGQDYQCRCVAVPVLEEYDEPAQNMQE